MDLHLNIYSYCCVHRVSLKTDWKAMQESINTWQLIKTVATSYII